jgi:hypothetical protein
MRGRTARQNTREYGTNSETRFPTRSRISVLSAAMCLDRDGGVRDDPGRRAAVIWMRPEHRDAL